MAGSIVTPAEMVSQIHNRPVFNRVWDIRMAYQEGDSLSSISDALLLERAHEGDTSSFDALFYRHYDRVYGVLFRLLGDRGAAEDALQEVFLKLYRQRFGRGREHNISAWLYRVAVNTGYNAIRSRKRLWQRNTILLPDPTDQPTTPAERLAQAEERQRVRRALAQLTERQVQLLLLRQMNFSYEELAAACQVAPGSVGTLLRRAAQAFREAYEQLEND